MRIRIISFLLIMSFLAVTVSPPLATAESRASDYISRYNALLSSGDNTGELDLTYHISTHISGVTRLGILAIFVYRTDGSIARTIVGNTTNGLLRTSGSVAGGTYTITMEPGVAYYCAIRFIAENASGNDVRYYTTNTAVAPL